MRVLMTGDTVGGVWNYALELTEALAPHGVQVTLATMGAPLTAAQRAETRRLPNLQIAESRYRLEWMDDPWADVEQAGVWLLDLAARLRPALVHLNGYAHAALPWRAPRLVVAHSCALSWWQAVRGTSPPATWDRYRQAVTDGLQAADHVIAPTQAMLHAVAQHYGPLRAAGVVPNARQAGAFRPGPKEPLILAVGRLWDEAKNIGLLATVAPRLAWPVYVAGDSRHPDGGVAALPNVHLLGRLAVDEIAPWFGRAAIYALPARYEPFGLSVLEAALAGCALVLGDIPSLRELWDGAALFVPPTDPAAWASALQGLIAAPDQRNALGQCARQRALSFTPARMAAGYLAVYARLVETEVRCG